MGKIVILQFSPFFLYGCILQLNKTKGGFIMSKKINLGRIKKASESAVPVKVVTVEINGEKFEVQILQGIKNAQEVQFMKTIASLVDEVKDRGMQDVIPHDMLFLLAMLETFTDIEFERLNLDGKMELLAELTEQEVVIEVASKIPESVIKKTTELLAEIADFVQKNVNA